MVRFQGTRTSPPTIRPVSLAEFKSHALIEGNLTSDSLLELYLDAALAFCEDYTGRALADGQFRILSNYAYCIGLMETAPVTGIVISYYDDEGERVAYGSNEWTYSPGTRSFRINSYSYEPVEVVYSVEPFDAPAMAKMAILNVASDLHENRIMNALEGGYTNKVVEQMLSFLRVNYGV